MLESFVGYLIILTQVSFMTFLSFSQKDHQEDMSYRILSSENTLYTWNHEVVFPSDVKKGIKGAVFLCEQYSQYIEIPHTFAHLITKARQICSQPPTVERIDAYYFLLDSDGNQIQNSDQIDEKTHFSLVVRTNYGTGWNNYQNPYVYDMRVQGSDIGEDLMNADFSESWVFLSEEIIGKCASYVCEISTEKIPVFMKQYLENSDNRYWFMEDFGGEKMEIGSGKMKIFFKKHQALGENFIFFTLKAH